MLGIKKALATDSGCQGFCKVLFSLKNASNIAFLNT